MNNLTAVAASTDEVGCSTTPLVYFVVDPGGVKDAHPL